MKVKTKIIEYRGEKILFTAGLFCTLGLCFKTMTKAKRVIDNTIKQKELGLY